QGVADALAEYEANRSSGNGDDSHDSGSGGRRLMPTTCECMYSDFLKCQPLNIKGTEGVNAMENIDEDDDQQELALMCGRIFPEESDQVEKYVGGLPDMIQGSVMASKPKTMQEAIEFANELMDQKIPKAYSVGPSEKKEYAGTLPLCNKCKLHHNGPCTVKCVNCNRVGHLTRDCRSPAAANNQRTLTCYECGNQMHYRSDCPKLKNQNHRKQAGGTEAHEMVYALGGEETD
ncbi:reverse transcriptase domain-containing protein, partial [Tanacetum coccineum]